MMAQVFSAFLAGLALGAAVVNLVYAILFWIESRDKRNYPNNSSDNRGDT